MKHPQRHIENNRHALLGKAALAHKEGRLPEAIDYYKRVLRLYPGDVDATYGMGIAAWTLGDIPTGVRLLRIVIARNPAFAEAHYNLGCMLQNMRDPVGAMACYHQALSIDPKMASAWGNLANALRDLGDAQGSLECYNMAMQLAADGTQVSAEARYNICYPLLSSGRWTEGWAAYEQRFNVTVFKSAYVMRHRQPLWDGEADLNGKRLLLHAEQGFGDTLMCLRFVHTLCHRYHDMDLLLEVQRPLLRLVEQQFHEEGPDGIWRNITVQAQDEFKHAEGCSIHLAMPGAQCDCVDYQLPMMSLMHRLHIVPSNVPVDTIPYVTVSPRGFAGDTPVYDPVLPDIANEGLKVGYCFAGSREHKNDKNRSIAIELWKPLFQVPGVHWYSLQVDWEVTGFPSYDLRKLITDFQDTATLIEQLDLVVTVDTAIAHLAGAMGKATFILLPAVPDFRWMLNTKHTPWYPTAHLFRQQHAGDWPGVIDRVRQVLVEITTMPRGEHVATGPAQAPAADVPAATDA